MSGIADKRQAIFNPRRKHVHIQELPDFQRLVLGLVQECKNSWVKVPIHLPQLGLARLPSPPFSTVSCVLSNTSRDLLLDASSVASFSSLG